FLVARIAELAHDEHVQLGVQRARHLVSDGDTAARQREHEQVLVALQVREPLGQHAAGVLPVVEDRLAPSHDAASCACAKCAANHFAAASDTRSSAPGSSNRCVAPGTTRSSFSHCMRSNEPSFNSITPQSAPPTIKSVGAFTAASAAAPARSGRPPRDTTAAIALPR